MTSDKYILIARIIPILQQLRELRELIIERELGEDSLDLVGEDLAHISDYLSLTTATLEWEDVAHARRPGKVEDHPRAEDADAHH